MFLYHYYDRAVGPFHNLSDLSVDAAEDLLDTIRKEKPDSMCAKRQENYVQDRLYYEKILREEFIKKGGQVVRKAPHYMVVEHSPWLSSWYDNMAYIKIPIVEFNVKMLGSKHRVFYG
ncbi:MAG: hypothetical protein OSJ61_19670 [Lachnospiraceae bacterium]|nr:hypothetical protein [Lachnospiraceae bacterium]